MSTVTLDVTTIAGVLNDGSADVGSLITSQITNDMILYFPEGTYLFTTALYIENKSNVTIKGTMLSELKKDGDNDSPVIYLNGCTNCSIQYLFIFTYPDRSSTNGNPLLLVNCSAANTSNINISNLCIIDCSINTNAGALILLDGCSSAYTTSYVTVENCFMNGNNRCGVGISQSRVKYSTIQYNSITNTGYEGITIDNASNFCKVYKNNLSYAYGGTGCIGLDNSHYCTIDSNYIINMASNRGIAIVNNFTEEFMTSEGETPDTTNNTITNNIIQKCTYGIYIEKRNTTAYDNTIMYNTFLSNTTAISMINIDIDKMTIENNTFSSNTYTYLFQ